MAIFLLSNKEECISSHYTCFRIVISSRLCLYFAEDKGLDLYHHQIFRAHSCWVPSSIETDSFSTFRRWLSLHTSRITSLRKTFEFNALDRWNDTASKYPCCMILETDIQHAWVFYGGLSMYRTPFWRTSLESPR